jgi:hypothetical protein
MPLPHGSGVCCHLAKFIPDANSRALFPHEDED